MNKRRGKPPRYTAKQVREWRKGRAAGVSFRVLAKAHNVPLTTLYDALSGRYYRWVK